MGAAHGWLGDGVVYPRRRGDGLFARNHAGVHGGADTTRSGHSVSFVGAVESAIAGAGIARRPGVTAGARGVKTLLVPVIGWPLLIVGLLASGAAVGMDQRHVWAAMASLALVLPPGVVAVWLVQRWRWSPFGRVAAVVLTSVLRLLIGFGGGLVVFLLLRQPLKWDPLTFWGWLVGTYLVALTTETAVLTRYVSQAFGLDAERPVNSVVPEVAGPEREIAANPPAVSP